MTPPRPGRVRPLLPSRWSPVPLALLLLALALGGMAAHPAADLAHELLPRVVGSSQSNIYHVESCRHARRISPRNRLSWPSPAAARQAGYRACRVCRPG